MADLAASAVTIERSWTEGGTAGKDVVCREVTLVLTGQGTAANSILASVLQLAKIEQAHSFRDDTDRILLAGPSYDGSELHLYDVEQATDASRSDPADITDTVRGIVKGWPA